jgi:hypothetical protein
MALWQGQTPTMFVRPKRSVHGDRVYEYLQIVRSYRTGKSVRQEVIATLGRRDELVASGDLDKLLQSLGRYSARLKVVEGYRADRLRARTAREWGPELVFGRLWERQGLPQILHRLAEGRRFEFDVERAAFAMSLQRLRSPGSDLHGAGWVKTIEAPGVGELTHRQFYTTCSFLNGVRGKLEEELFFRDRDLFSDGLDLVFIDTTSTFVYRTGETEMRERGYSRDRRPDLPQIVICLAVDQRGWPVAWEMYPGSTADKKAFRHIVGVLRERLKIRRVIVVADRGMISKDSIEMLTGDAEAPYEYILGCKMRRQKEVSEDVLSRAGRYHAVRGNLEVKEVVTANGRYVVCRNPDEAVKDAAAREVILARLEETLAKDGAKSLVRNKGYARFIKVQRDAVTIDKKAVEADARLDGKFVLRTSTDLPADEVALRYKDLWRVERAFRTEKSVLEIRPLFHKVDRNCVGHIVPCFLALRLEVDLQMRLDERGVAASWPDVMRDLGQVQAVTLDADGIRYLLRTDMQGTAYEAFAAAGVRPPSPATEIGPAPPDDSPIQGALAL